MLTIELDGPRWGKGSRQRQLLSGNGREVELPAWTTTEIAFEKTLAVPHQLRKHERRVLCQRRPSGAHAVSAFDGACIALPVNGLSLLILPMEWQLCVSRPARIEFSGVGEFNNFMDTLVGPDLGNLSATDQNHQDKTI